MSRWRFRRRRRRPPAARRAGRPRPRAGVADWPQLLERDDVLILDTETTGLDSEAEVIDIALINTRGAILFNSLAMPRDDVPSQAARIHGITTAMLRRHGAPDWPTLYAQLLPLLNEAALVLVYNAAFDRRLLQQTCERHDLHLPAVNWRCAMNDYAAWRRQRFGANSGYGLERAYNRECGAGVDQQHRALSDCHMVLALMNAVAGRD